METWFVFVVVALMSLGLISLGELIVRSLKSRNSEPVDYEPAVNAIANGMMGDEPEGFSHFFGAIASHLLHFLEHFRQH